MRCDKALTERGLCRSRTRAQALIEEGRVRVNSELCMKPSFIVSSTDTIEISPLPSVRHHPAFMDGFDYSHYVSRGAAKLLSAYNAFGPEGLERPAGRKCLDIGASTGGFTQVLLDKGAQRVIALDVGHGQLDRRIAEDPRVFEMSGVNFRDTVPQDLPYLPDYAVSDVSFISLAFIIPPLQRIALAALKEGARAFTAILLIKPQFEVGRGNLGKGGIVTGSSLSRSAVDKVLGYARRSGFTVRGCVPSDITGLHGNREYLLWITVDNMRDITES